MMKVINWWFWGEGRSDVGKKN